MINKYILDEALRLEVTDENKINFFQSLAMMNKFSKVNLKMNEKNEPYYESDVEELLKSDAEMEDLVNLRYGGWEYNVEQNKLIKTIKL